MRRAERMLSEVVPQSLESAQRPPPSACGMMPIVLPPPRACLSVLSKFQGGGAEGLTDTQPLVK